MRTGNKKKKHWELSLITAGILLSVLPLISTSHAAHPCEQWSGKALSIQGNVEVSRAGEALWEPISSQDFFCPGDRVRVGKNSRAAILLPNETLLRLAEGTSLTFIKEEKKENAFLALIEGVIHFISRTPRSLNIKTPFVNASIDGTEFVLKVESDQTRIWVFEGQVSASNAQGTLVLTSGEAAVAQKGKAPVRKLVVNPRDEVQWALYYPPVIDYRLENYTTGPDAPMLRKALTLYRKGDLSAAFACLASVPENSRTAQYHDLLASFFLTVGQINKARSNLNQALLLDPNDGIAYALQSVIAVTQNNTKKALELAQKGVELRPQSPVPQIALSYALQARFDIEKAQQSVERAVDLAPQDALAWARLAELELSLGNIDRANASARKAVELDPDQPRTQTVLGFANLTKIETDKAETAFKQAMDLDPADPLPRLGLGLAKIRQGNLDEGTEQIETAAILDPDNSLIRSYLGKAYYEQKRTKLARTEFAIAKELDPNDPTPWFYDAILKQTENRPGNAFSDLQRSIELNDNRAVYRSRLMLDEDRAARGTSLARIYDDLGFQQLALAESTKSLSMDPTNHSAHRFLSDTYTRLPQHRIAQVSELLQAQLLQPVNINPVQPRLSTKGVNLVSGISQEKAAFNEYTPLFERNRMQLNVAGIAGNHGTYGNEAVVSGLADAFSYSLGQFHYETDGFRKNSDIKHDIVNAFAQVPLSDKINVQFEYRRRDTEQGDTQLSLDPNFIPTARRDLKQDIERIGLHLSPTSQNDFITSFIYSDRREGFQDENPFSQLETIDDREGYNTEIQYLFHENRFNLLLGGGIYQIDFERKSTKISTFSLPSIFPFPSMDPIITTSVNNETCDIKGENLYIYTNIRFPTDLVWTLGLSYETYEQTKSSHDLERIHPKLGLRWDITHSLHFRATFVENIKRQLVVDQTIEPTQIAGFNQFFDDYNGSVAQLYGVAVDATLTDGLYGGVEFTRRNLTQASEIVEENYRSYIDWNPNSNWSFNAEYIFERDRLDFKLETTQIPLTLRYFGHKGFWSQFCVTSVWQEQHGSNYRLTDNFKIVDVAIGYRLPKRRGTISIEFGNLFDEDFRFKDASFKTSDKFSVIQPFLPSRTILARIALNF